MDGGVRTPGLNKKPVIQKQVRLPVSSTSQNMTTVVSELARVPKRRIVFSSDGTQDRRNPPFPNGFQPESIRSLISKQSYNIPSDTFPSVTIDQQLEALSSISNRELLETGFGASEQCKALGISNKSCFLCGFALDEPRLAHDKKSDFGYTQCEHLLPAAAAILVYGLVNTTAEGKESGHFYRDNYLYAHNGCNGEKGSRLFISMNPSTYTPEGSPILIDNIRKYLDDLYNNTTISTLVTDKEGWITQQLESITDIYRPLSLELGRRGSLALLTGVGTYFKNIDFLYSKLVNAVKNKAEYVGREATISTLMSLGRGRKTFRRRHNGKSVRRSTAKGNGSTSRTYRKLRASNRKRT